MTSTFHAGLWLKRVGLALTVAWLLAVVLLYLFYDRLAAGRSHGEMTAIVRTASSAILPAAAVLFVLGFMLEKRRQLHELLALRRRQLEQLKRLARRLAEEESQAVPGQEELNRP